MRYLQQILRSEVRYCMYIYGAPCFVRTVLFRRLLDEHVTVSQRAALRPHAILRHIFPDRLSASRRGKAHDYELR